MLTGENRVCCAFVAHIYALFLVLFRFKVFNSGEALNHFCV